MNKKRNRDFGENGFEGWGGYMAAKKAKLQDQFNEGAIKEGIFKGVSIHVNGYTDPTAEELKRIMMDNGGNYNHYYSTVKTTHIIATNLPDVKIKQLKSMHIKVVRPDWIMASLKAGTLLDYRDYLLYSHQSTSQPCLNFGTAASTSKSNGSLNGKSSPVIEEAQLQETDKCQTATKHQPSDPSTSNASTSRSMKTATDANFLSEFYNNSRLHHISTMGVMFKQHISKLRDENRTEFPGRARLKEWIAKNPLKQSTSHLIDDMSFSLEDPFNQQPQENKASEKTIMHIDMDCFFVSVGIRDRPDLKGVPVAVTHSKGSSGRAREGANIEFERNYYKQKREAKIKSKVGEDTEVTVESRIDDLNENESLSEIASCSYEARNAGVKNGMFMGTAIKLCPNIRTIPYDFEGYKEVAGILYDTVASYTLDIEAVSCDEMFVDCTTLLKDTGATPMQFASCLRAEIREKTRCPASAGFGSNRLLARLATKKAKPDGQYHLEENAVLDHMKSIRVGNLPGVGYSMVYRLKALGIGTCEDLQKMTLDQLRLEGFGTKTAESLYNHCRGKDDRTLTFGQERKSVSAEVNYGIRFKTSTEAEDFLTRLSAEVHSRLAGDGARCITLKLAVRAKDAPVETAKFMGHGVCDMVSKSVSLPRAVRLADAITKEVLTLYKSLTVNPCDLRGVGIQLTRLEKGSGSGTGALDAFLIKRPVDQTTPKKNNIPESKTTPPSNDSLQRRAEVTPQKEPPKTKPSPSKKTTVPVSPAETGKTKSVNISPLGKGRRKGHNKNQPLPRLNGRTTKGTIHDFMVARKKTPVKVDRAKIDPDVLAELPEDIRHEILEEYSKADLEIAASTSRTDTADVEQQQQQATVNDETEVTLSPLSLYNVSFSQVDPGYLQALPPELQNEIKTELLEQKKRKRRKIELDKKQCQGKTEDSGKGNDQEIDAEFLAALPQDLREELERDIKVQRTADVIRTKDRAVEDDSVGSTEEASTSAFSESNTSLREALLPSHLRPLLKSWVESCGTPQSCDVKMVSEFLQEMIISKDIDSIASIMRGLRRIISKGCNDSWWDAYNEIVTNVQKTMVMVYKSPLDIDER